MDFDRRQVVINGGGRGGERDERVGRVGKGWGKGMQSEVEIDFAATRPTRLHRPSPHSNGLAFVS